MCEPANTFTLTKGRTLEIYHDEDAKSPRTSWDNAGTLATWHDRSTIGEVQLDRRSSTHMIEQVAREVLDAMKEDIGREKSHGGKNRYSACERALSVFDNRLEQIVSKDMPFDEYQNKIKALIDHYAILLPVFAYEHGGITISTGSFSDPWDSGQVGVIFITKEKARHEWGGASGILNKKRIAQAVKCLELEVKSMDEYLTGDVYGYVLKDKKGDEIDSCWGFYGSNVAVNGILDQADITKRELVKVLKELQAYEIKEAREAGIKLPRLKW